MANIRPPAAAIEDLVLDDIDNFAGLSAPAVAAYALKRGASLASQLVAVARADKALFAENEAHLVELSRAAIEARLTALWRQLTFAGRHGGGDFVEQASIAEGVLRDTQALAFKQPKEDAQAWDGIFALTRKRIRKHASALEQRRLRRALETWFEREDCATLVGTALSGEGPDSGRVVAPTLAAHHQRVAPRLRSEVWRAAIARHIAQALEPQRREAFAARLTALLAGSSPLTETFDWAFDKCLNTTLRSLRDQWARAQVSTVAPTLWDASLVLNEADIEALVDAEPASERLLQPPAALTFAESRELYVERRNALLAEARAAMQQQISLVHHRARVARFQDDARELASTTPDAAVKQELLTRYRQEVAQQWSGERAQLLLTGAPTQSSTSTKYQQLFARVDAEIEKVVTVQWASAVSSASATPSAPAAAGGGHVGASEGKADASGVGEAQDLAAPAADGVDDALLPGQCPAPSCTQASAACARFASTCLPGGACPAHAQPWRLACLQLTAQCAAVLP